VSPTQVRRVCPQNAQAVVPKIRGDNRLKVTPEPS